MFRVSSVLVVGLFEKEFFNDAISQHAKDVYLFYVRSYINEILNH